MKCNLSALKMQEMAFQRPKFQNISVVTPRIVLSLLQVGSRNFLCPTA